MLRRWHIEKSVEPQAYCLDEEIPAIAMNGYL